MQQFCWGILSESRRYTLKSKHIENRPFFQKSPEYLPLDCCLISKNEKTRNYSHFVSTGFYRNQKIVYELW